MLRDSDLDDFDTTQSAQLMQAKTKAEALELMISRGSTVGWWSDLPEGLWDKLQGWKTRKQ
mgnify:CR=1 FL=1